MTTATPAAPPMTLAAPARTSTKMSAALDNPWQGAPGTTEPERRSSTRRGDFGRLPPPRTVHALAADGVRLNGTEYGNPAAAHTAVFLHGFCLSEMAWASQIRALIASYGPAIRVISYDHRGHGQSQGAPQSTYRIRQLADDLAAVLTQLHVAGRLTLVGHSMGAMVALSYACRPQQPVRPDGLVLIGAAAGRITQRGVGRLLSSPGVTLVCRLGRRTPSPALRGLIAPICAAVGHRLAGRSAQGTLIDVIASALATTPAATVFGFLPAFRDHDEYPNLGLVRARTVVISGQADVLTPVAHSLDLAAGVPAAEHICITGAGHMLAQQAFETVHRAITRVVGVDGALTTLAVREKNSPAQQGTTDCARSGQARIR